MVKLLLRVASPTTPPSQANCSHELSLGRRVANHFPLPHVLMCQISFSGFNRKKCTNNDNMLQKYNGEDITLS